MKKVRGVVNFEKARLLLELVIELHTLKEVITALGVLDVLNAQVNALGDDAIANTLVNNNTNSMWSHIVDNTSFAMVELVWHALVNGRICRNINNVTNFVNLQIG